MWEDLARGHLSIREKYMRQLITPEKQKAI